MRPPAGLEQEVDPAHLVLCGEIGMITATGATGIGEDQNSLGPVHKISRLRDIGARRARLEHLASIASNDQAASTACYFGDMIDTEPLDDRLATRRYRRQGKELLDQDRKRDG